MKLSIITINMNDSDGLSKTIQSVLSQTFTDYEFIVIDGGSDDGSIEIIKQYESKIAYWVSESDKGIYDAMNKGIEKAKGEYCYFLNAGDYLPSPQVFESVFKVPVNSSFICGNLMIDKNGVFTRSTDYSTRDWAFSLYDIFSGFLAHQAFFVKKEMFDKYGLYDNRLKIMSDWKLFFIAIGIHRESVIYKDVDLAVYDTNGLSSRIGGKAIYAEKKQVAQEELSEEIFIKLDRLYFLEQKGFMIDFILSKKWIYFIFRAFYKLCTSFRLTKS